MPKRLEILVGCERCRRVYGVKPSGIDMTVGGAIQQAIGHDNWSRVQWTEKKFMGTSPETKTEHRLICGACGIELRQWMRDGPK